MVRQDDQNPGGLWRRLKESQRTARDYCIFDGFDSILEYFKIEPEESEDAENDEEAEGEGEGEGEEREGEEREGEEREGEEREVTAENEW